MEEGRVRRGKLDIVDMQASEVVATYDPLPNQNSSLPPYDISASSFRNVVNTLIHGNNKSIVPYNDSKVTQILRNALGGSSKARMLFHISPTARCREATIATLRTAAQCQLIENTPAYLLTENSLVHQII